MSLPQTRLSLRSTALLASCLLLFAQQATSQQPSPQQPTSGANLGPRLGPLGRAHPPSANPPILEVRGEPLLGSPFRVDIRNGQAGQFGLLAVGPTAANPVIIPGGHPIYVPSPSLVQAIVLNPAGERRGAVVAAALPAAALGVDLAFQGAFFDASLQSGFATTQAIAYRIAAPVALPEFPRPVREYVSSTDLKVLFTDLDGDGLEEELTLGRASLTAPAEVSMQSYRGWIEGTPRTELRAPIASSMVDLRDLSAVVSDVD